MAFFTELEQTFLQFVWKHNRPVHFCLNTRYFIWKKIFQILWDLGYFLPLEKIYVYICQQLDIITISDPLSIILEIYIFCPLQGPCNSNSPVVHLGSTPKLEFSQQSHSWLTLDSIFFFFTPGSSEMLLIFGFCHSASLSELPDTSR